jgi:hypothetical protein
LAEAAPASRAARASAGVDEAKAVCGAECAAKSAPPSLRLIALTGVIAQATRIEPRDRCLDFAPNCTAGLVDVSPPSATKRPNRRSRRTRTSSSALQPFVADAVCRIEAERASVSVKKRIVFVAGIVGAVAACR